MPNLEGEFLAVAAPCSGRKGFESLVEWLFTTTDFLLAPASTKYHGAHEGGLAQHSINVARRLTQLAEQCPEIPWQNAESPVLIGLLHDICKCNFYTVSTRNAKNEATGKWEKVPYYAVDDQIPLGHGEKSVILIQQHMRLTAEEIMCIRWHMGAYEEGGKMSLSAAMSKYPQILLTQTADLMATYVDEKEDAN